MHRKSWLAGLLAGGVLLASAAAAHAARGDWPRHGLDAAETRFSPLAAIKPANVGQLAPAWYADLSGISHRAFEATPIVGGRQYVAVAVGFGGGLPQVAAGKALYERRCYHCHGGAVISGGEVADLRYSALLGDARAFAAVVHAGGMADSGMPVFGGLDPADVEALRAYVIARANADARAAASH